MMQAYVISLGDARATLQVAGGKGASMASHTSLHENAVLRVPVNAI